MYRWEVPFLLSSVIVEHKNGKKFDLDALGYHVKTFEPWGSDWTQSSTSINKYLLLDTSRKVQAKTATLELNTMASDVTGLQLKFMDLTRVFNGEYNFYIYFAEIPHIRWEATVNGAPTFTMSGNSGFGSASIPLYFPKGFAETTHSTGEIGSNIPANQYPLGFFGIGTHFEHNGENPIYSIANADTIKIFNPGNIALRAKGLHGKIYAEDGSNFIIKNNTNHTKFTYNRSFGRLELDGYICTVDGNFDYKNTDHGHIDIERGWNSFNVYGASRVSFDLRFYY